ncbi:MAG: hypothetical protein LBL67_04570 [Coriobacteriales bacterium]|jgi:indolepyruvate ferredoxin oxidoreductase alpha subunit|nr:hypothetical protein [Coriobacteriales bacterium]
MDNSQQQNPTQTLVMGNQAVALGALKAGVRVAAGYPGTPSSEVLETLSAYGQSHKIGPFDLHVEWSVNEKSALEVCAGAAFAGARSLFTCKMVGLNVAADPLATLAYLGVKGGLVLLVADDPGPISSQTEQDTRQFAEFVQVPVLDPSTPREALEMAEYAFELSERYAKPVILRTVTRICHSTESLPQALVEFDYQAHPAEGFTKDSRWVTFPPLAQAAHRAMPELFERIGAEFCTLPWNQIEPATKAEPDQPRIGLAASGMAWSYLKDALAGAAGDLRLLKLATVFPLPEPLLLDFLQGLDEVLVFEELAPTLERALLRVAGKHHLPVRVRGKLTGEVQAAGELSADIVGAGIAAFRADGTDFECAQGDQTGQASATNPLPFKLPARPPVLCAGCPHRASFLAVKQAMRRQKATFSGDIGCYTLGNAAPLDMVDTCVCMGGGFSVPQGMYWAEPEVKHIGFVGDSTFFASGITPVVNAVYNHAPVTFVILDNATTAMTGTQPHPGTGIRIATDASPADAENAISIRKVLEGCGVRHIYECDPLQLDQAIATVKQAVADTDDGGPSAIILESPCIQIDRSLQPGAGSCAVIDYQACTHCRVCTDLLGCPALSDTGDQVQVDATLCNGCTLCAQVCHWDAISFE